MTAAIPTVTVEKQSREAWIKQRYDFNIADGSGEWYLGATDKASISRMHKYCAPLRTWANYRGIIDCAEEQLEMQRGTSLEPWVASCAQYKFRKQFKITDNADPTWSVRSLEMVRHPLYYHLGVNPDYEVLHPEFGWIPLEIKTHHWKMREEYGEQWSNQMPLNEIIQGNDQCHVLNLNDGIDRKAFIIAAAFGYDPDQDVVAYIDMYDEALAERITQKALRFIDEHLLTGIAPEPTGMECDTEVYKALYPTSTPDMVVMRTDNTDLLYNEYIKARKEVEDAEERQNEIKNRVRGIFGDADTLYGPDGRKLTYKSNKNGVRGFSGPR